ncbi:MAG: DUF4259 domain-containing protein [Gammaproteobacteria bacterium]|nr:DUF4259 domain-containing protein [Gammaproteobacteria bacterium]
MGTWGPGLLENDDALDFMLDFSERKSESFIKNALSTRNDEGDINILIAAASIVLLRKGYIVPDISGDLIRWAAKSRKQWLDDIVVLAIDASNYCLADEDFRESWNESETYNIWLENVKYLKAHLSKPDRKITKEEIPKEPPTLKIDDTYTELIDGVDLDTLVATCTAQSHIIIDIFWGDWEKKHLEIVEKLLLKFPEATIEIDREKRCQTLPDKELISFIQSLPCKKLCITCKGFDYAAALKDKKHITGLLLDVRDKKPKCCLDFLLSIKSLSTLKLRIEHYVDNLDFLSNLDGLKGLSLVIGDYKSSSLSKMPSFLEELNFACLSFDSKPKEHFDVGSIYECASLKALSISVASGNHKFEFHKLENLERLMIDDQSSHHPWRVKSIDNVKHLKNLKFLILHCVDPESLSFLNELPALEGLDFWNVSIDSIKDLSNSKSLKRLAVMNFASNFKIEDIALLPVAEQLFLPSVNKTDFHLLKQLNNLKVLSVWTKADSITDDDYKWLRKLEEVGITLEDDYDKYDDLEKKLKNFTALNADFCESPWPLRYLSCIHKYGKHVSKYF